MNKYLLELGVEELPYKFIPQAINQLKTSFEKLFKENNIEYTEIKVYGTPRRLAVIAEGLSEKQNDETKIVKGPIKRIAYDENGNLSKAGLGFLNKNNLTEDKIYIENDYIQAKIEVKGKLTTEILQENLSSLILKLQGSHFMRWSDFEEKFSRPIRWIVSIFNEKEIPIEIINVKSGKITNGHRFSKQNIEINNPDEYVEKLKKAHVIVNQEERKELIIQQSKAEAEKVGAITKYSDDLLEEVTYLCEYPKAVICDFDEKYLTIPQEVTVTVMSVHQRYFALYKNDKLTNKFITITNYIGDEFENIKAGNLRVIKARLDDAVFFFNEDTKTTLVSKVDALKGMTFQKGMGSIFDKTQRIIKLSKMLAEELSETSPTIERTALLCKADLTTSLVFEFTELQGYIGSDYARVSGEDPKVVDGIKEHYFPLNAESELAQSIEGQIVGIADKIDTICAVFTEGKKPTGSSDPLGVRRAALGIIKTILNFNLNINLYNLIQNSLELLPVKNDCIKDIKEFFEQRLIIYLSENYKKDVLEACSNNNPLINLCDYLNRVKALSNLDNAPLLESINRVIKILKEEKNDEINPKLFKNEAESMLFEQVNKITENNNYTDYLKELTALNSYIEKFFDNVLVMDEDIAVKNNRLALLTKLKKKYEKLADFSKLQY